jgi:isoleucyl-tRNA synthetase
LEADIEVFADDQLRNSLAKLGDELRFVTITSNAALRDLGEATHGDAVSDSLMDGLKVSLKRSDASKCVRCWHFIDDVGSNADHPEVCGRCVANISGESEVRRYA